MKTQPDSTSLRGIATALALSFGYLQPCAQAADDLPWFRIVMASQSTAVLTLTGVPGQTLQLYKATSPAAVWKSAVIPAGGTRVVIAYILPTGTYYARVVGSTVSHTLDIASRISGDLNADRKADVLWQHSTTGQISVWHMDGRTKLGEAVISTQPAAGWKLVNNGDFNTDRMPDLVLQNAATGDVVLWYMNGLAMLSQGPLNVQMGSKLWCVVAVADMNKDGMLDLLYQNSSTGNVQVRYLNKTRQVTGSGVFPQQLSPVYRLCAVGDVNGDGSPDAIWQNRNTGAVTVTYLNGLAVVAGGGGLSAQPSFSWEVAGIEDRNGDGKADLLLQHRGTGQTAVWFLNGRTVLAGGGATSFQQTSLLNQAKNSRSLFAPPPAGFSFIPGGNFLMGDQSSPPLGLGEELPVHTVNVSAFHMAKYEVTKELWDSVRIWGAANGYTDLAVGNGTAASKGANHPVHSVYWYDMVKWCNARSQKEGLVPCYYTDAAQTVIYKAGYLNLGNTMVKWGANGYRLPTEAEWEKAARGGFTGKNFPWGNTISHSQANYSSYIGYSYDISPTRGFHPTYATGSYPYTAPVTSFAPNGYGLYNVIGNVREWCWDWYGGAYAIGAQIDPRGPASGLHRVHRGGFWFGFAGECRVARRNGYSPAGLADHMGFRPVRRAVP